MAISVDNIDVGNLEITLNSLKERIEMYRRFARESKVAENELMVALKAEGVEYPEDNALVSWHRGREAAYRLAQSGFEHTLRSLEMDLGIWEGGA